jgi:ABC-type bacteriocin/lantibiotic exporter with double-glycine peptidase domain
MCRTVERAAHCTGSSRFAEKLPLGWHTPVLAGGSNLSAGQAQLVPLTAAKALLVARRAARTLRRHDGR